MSAIKISVCLASWNGAQYLKAQVDSILRQLGPDDELLVSDDGSTDHTVSILRAYGDKLRIVGVSRVGGVVPNFERVLRSANKDFVVLCDQDDVWLEGRLDLVRDRLQHVVLLIMNGEVVNANLELTGRDIYSFVHFRSGLLRTLASNRYVGCCMAFRHELLQIALPFPSRIQWHDWYLALIAELWFTHECSPIRTILFRRHATNASATGQRSRSSIFIQLRARFWMARAVGIASIRIVRHRLGLL